MKPLKERYELDAWNMISDYLKNLNNELLKAKVNSEKAREIVNDIASHIYYRADDYFEINGIIAYDNVLIVLNEIGTPIDIASTFIQNPEVLTSLEDPLNYYSKSKEDENENASTNPMLVDKEKQDQSGLSLIDNIEGKIQQITNKPIKITIIPALARLTIRLGFILILTSCILVRSVTTFPNYPYFDNVLALLFFSTLLLVLDGIILKSCIKGSTGIQVIDKLSTATNSLRFYRLISIMELIALMLPVGPTINYWSLENFYYSGISIETASNMGFRLSFFFSVIFYVLIQLILIEYFYRKDDTKSWIYWVTQKNLVFEDRIKFILPRLGWVAFLYIVISINIRIIMGVSEVYFSNYTSVNFAPIYEETSKIFVIVTITIILLLLLKYYRDSNRFEEFSYYIWSFRAFLIISLLNTEFINKFYYSYYYHSSTYFEIKFSPTTTSFTLILPLSILVAEVALEIFLIKKCNYLSATLPIINKFVANPSEYNYPASRHVSSFLNSIDNYTTSNYNRENSQVIQKSSNILTNQSQPPIISTSVGKKSQKIPKQYRIETINSKYPAKVNLTQKSVHKRSCKPKDDYSSNFGSFASYLFNKVLVATFTLIFIYYNILFLTLDNFYSYITDNWSVYNESTLLEIFNSNHQILLINFDVYITVGIILSTIILYQKILQPIRTRSDLLKSFIFFIVIIELFIVFLLLNNLVLFITLSGNYQRMFLAFIFLIVDLGALILLWDKPKLKKKVKKDETIKKPTLVLGGIKA